TWADRYSVTNGCSPLSNAEPDRGRRAGAAVVAGDGPAAPGTRDGPGCGEKPGRRLGRGVPADLGSYVPGSYVRGVNRGPAVPAGAPERIASRPLSGRRSIVPRVLYWPSGNRPRSAARFRA